MAASGLAVPSIHDRPAEAPKLLVLWLIGLAGVVAAVTTLALGLTNDEVDHVGMRVFLNDWITLNYIVAGLIAWWRRPDSRFGLLMVAAGFVNFVGTLDWATADVPFTIGVALDLLAPVLFLHVPRLSERPADRTPRPGDRRGAYAAAIGLGLVRMMLGGAGPGNLIQVFSASGAVEAVTDIQPRNQRILLGWDRRSRRAAVECTSSAPPTRTSRRLLCPGAADDCRAVLVHRLHRESWRRAGNRDAAASDLLRRRTRADRLSGRPPALPSRGRTGDRLARGRGGSRRRGRCAQDSAADPTLEVAYWVAEYETYADVDGRAIELPTSESRATTLIDRDDGVHVAALVHDTSLRDEHELLDAVTAAGGFALENARLHAELRARLEELKGSRARIIEVGQTERQRLERDLHDGAQQRLVALSLELGLLEERFEAHPDAREALDQTRREIMESLRGASRACARDPSGGRDGSRACGGSEDPRRGRRYRCG